MKLTQSNFSTRPQTGLSESALYEKALGYLGRREYSRLELQERLQRTASDVESIEAVLNRLSEHGYQSDARFAEMWLRRYGKERGKRRLEAELRQRGIAPAILQAAFEAEGLTNDETEEEAQNVLRKKFRTAPATPQEWDKQARFLNNRGFSSDIIRRILPRRPTHSDSSPPF